MPAPTEEPYVKLRVNPGFDPGQPFWNALLRDSKSAPAAAGIRVFQLLDDGEIVLPFEAAARFWGWLRSREGFSGHHELGRGGVPAVLFEPY